MATSLTRPEVISFVWISHIYFVCHQHAHLLLIHSGFGLVAFGLGLIALGLGLDLVALDSASYTSEIINISDHMWHNNAGNIFNTYTVKVLIWTERLAEVPPNCRAGPNHVFSQIIDYSDNWHQPHVGPSWVSSKNWNCKSTVPGNYRVSSFLAAHQHN